MPRFPHRVRRTRQNTTTASRGGGTGAYGHHAPESLVALEQKWQRITRVHPEHNIVENLLIVNIPTSRCSALRILTHTKRRLIRVKWFFVRTAARARSDPARDAGRLAMARSFHVKVRHERSLD